MAPASLDTTKGGFEERGGMERTVMGLATSKLSVRWRKGGGGGVRAGDHKKKTQRVFLCLCREFLWRQLA